MKRITTLAALVFATAAAGCVQVQEAPPIRDALPTAEQVRVNLPEDNVQTYALGQLSDTYMLTRRVSREFNGGAAWVLLLVHTIVQFPATDVDGNTYTWGPHSDALDPAEWKLIVTENEDASYDWRFEGRSKTVADAPWLTTVEGHAIPGDEPHRGTGEFHLNFDNAEEVNPIDNDAQGQVWVTYDLENRDGTDATLTMHIEGVEQNESGEDQPVEADYHYGEAADGSGNFQFSLHADLEDEGGTAFEDAVIRSRWQADGAGRGDLSISNGDLGQGVTVTASECWDTMFRRTFYSDSENWQPTEGEADSCVFDDQNLPNI